MKKLLSVVCMVIFTAFAGNALGSSGAEDLIKMASSGVDEEVLMAYIQTAPGPFDLSAEDIITLKDLGVPSDVINEALHHGRDSDSVTGDDLETGLEETDDAVLTTAAVAPPPEDLNISFFYESLYPYGNWLMIDGTWCWQPNAVVISPDWAPYYRYGKWVNSDWGWCWVSYYSWGWAPFHYGRWFNHPKHRWCWVPDTEWGPAWVSWRSGGGYYGWAPLPPHARYVRHKGFYFGLSPAGIDFEFNLTMHDYFFVPSDRFCDPHPWVYGVPWVRQQYVYHRSSHVRDAYRFEHDRFINHGIPPEEVSRASGRPVRPVTIAHDDIRPGEEIHRSRTSGDRLTVYRPEIRQEAPKNPEMIRMAYEKKATTQKKAEPDKTVIQRQKSARQETLKTEKVRARNSTQEKYHLERAAHYETNTEKQTEFENEAQVQEMKARRSQEHVNNIKRWNPPAEKKPAVVPQSKVVPKPSGDSPQQVKSRVQSQIKREAMAERKRDKVAEEMVRKSPPDRTKHGTDSSSGQTRKRR